MSVADRPLRADAERNRARLLEAARALFAERGLDVSMDDIAAAAGVGVGTAYRRFANREELVDALFDEHMDKMVRHAEAAAARPDAWDGLVTYLKASMRMQAENRGLKQLVFSSATGRDKVHAMREHLLPLIGGLIERAQQAGDLREDFTLQDLPVLSFMVGAVIDFAGPVADDIWERYLGILLDGLRAGSTAPLPRSALSQDQVEAAMDCWRPARR